MHRIVFLLFILFFTSPLLSKRFYIFGNNVIIREKPSIKSKVVMILNAGTKLCKTSKTKISSIFFKRFDYWYKITSNGKTGFVWGGLITDSVLYVNIDNDNKSELFMLKDFQVPYSPTIYSKIKKQALFGAEIRIYKNEKIIHRNLIPSKGFYIRHHYYGLPKIHKKRMPKNVFVFTFNYANEYWGSNYHKGISIYIMHGRRFLQRLDFVHNVGGIDESRKYKYIFPWQKKGKKNIIKVFGEHILTFPPNYNMKVRKFNFYYFWNGRKFEKSRIIYGKTFFRRNK